MDKSLEIAFQIVSERPNYKVMGMEEILNEVRKAYMGLKSIDGLDLEELKNIAFTKEEPRAPMTVTESIGDDYVTCMICGQKMKVLTQRHLGLHGMTQDEYRSKFGIPKRMALSARSVSEKRSESAKTRGIPENLRKYLDARKAHKKSIAE